MPPIVLGPQLPARRGFAPVAQRPSHNATAGLFGGQPKSDLRFSHPTKVYISSSTSHRFFCAFFGRKRGSAGATAAAFFNAAGDGCARNAGHAHDTALGIALAQELVHLFILRCFSYDCGYKAGFVLVAGMALMMPVAPDLVAAAFGAKMLCMNLLYPTILVA